MILLTPKTGAVSSLDTMVELINKWMYVTVKNITLLLALP